MIASDNNDLTDSSGPTNETFVRVGSHRLHISRRGDGPPLMLIGGLGNSLGLWDELVTRLPHVETIAVDGPGMGSSSTPFRPLSMVELADVYACLIKALGLEKVSVCGLSFGGAVTQQLAFQSPSLVDRLVLCGTGPGLGGFPASPEVLTELAMPWRYYAASRLRRVAPMIYGGRMTGDSEAFERHMEDRLASPPSLVGYYFQLAALVGWSSLPWLTGITQPTLVLAGDADPVYPVENAHLLGSRIPLARVEVLPGEGHMFVVDSASDVARLVEAFLAN